MIGGDTAFGMIATYMDGLHLSYQEVLNMPLRNLLMMQRDKCRLATGKVLREATEEEEMAFIARKMQNMH